MSSKDQIRKELDELVGQGKQLILALRKAAGEAEDSFVSIHVDYQFWYTRALKAVEGLAHDRYEEFRRYYEPDPKRKSLDPLTYVVQDFLMGVSPAKSHYPHFDTKARTAQTIFNQLAILKSIASRIDSVLANLETGLLADLQEAELETCRKLLKTSARAAGSLAGVILEGHLQKVAPNHGITVRKKSPTIGDLNDALKKGTVYDTATWRKVSYLADIRNACSHKKGADPSQTQVEELIDGVNWVIKNVT